MNRRYELSKFDFSEADAIAEHLEAMAAKGWQLDRAGPYLWGYRKAAPQSLRYAVGYLPGPHSAAPLPAEDLAAFRGLYEAAGWHFVTDWYFVQIFCAEPGHATPPDTDERVKYFALRRSIGKQIWISVLLAALIALLMGITISAFCRNPLLFCSTNTFLLGPWILLAGLIAVVAPVVRYGFLSRRALRAVNTGHDCPRLGKRHRRFRDAVLWLIILLFTAAIVSDAVTTTGAGWKALRYAVWVAGFMGLMALNDWSRRTNDRWFFWIVAIAGLTVFLIVFLNLPRGAESRQVSREELPLSAQDLGYDTEEDVFNMLGVSESVLLRRVNGQSHWDWDSVQYTVYEPKADWLWDACRQDAESYLIWEPLADGIWISTEDAIYHMPALSYLIETDSVLIRLHTPQLLDETQLATAIALLSP